MTPNQGDPFPLATGVRGALDGVSEALALGEDHDVLDAFTPTTSTLLKFWFQDDYCSVRSVNFHRGQRDAILAILYAHEVVGAPTLRALYEQVAPGSLVQQPGLLGRVDGRHHQHPKYAAKMATGTGKTWVLNALLVWQYLNHVADREDARFTSNFLVVAPGLIVYDRLLDSFLGKERGGERDFLTSDIFQIRELFIPDDFRDAVFGFLQSSVVTKNEIGKKVTGDGMLAITNWHLLAGIEDPDFVGEVEAPGADVDAKTAVDSMFPVTPGTSAGNELPRLDRAFLRGGPLRALTELPDLLVFNDEAHHIHEVKRSGDVTEVEWQRSLTEIASTKAARFIQVDFSATPFNEVGTGKNRGREYFPHIVVDFDLATAMGDGLVKSLALDRRREIGAIRNLDFRAERDDNGKVLGLSEGQRVMLRAGVAKRANLEESFAQVDTEKHPKLLVVCEDTSVTPFVVEFLQSCGLGEDEILRVDSNSKGEMSKSDWEVTRERLFDIDRHVSPKVIVSVLMLREGFDVNSICVIVPLRSSSAQILLEQTIGRGLRLMWRGDDQIDEAKRETRQRFQQRMEPGNYFDVLFIVEHPEFTKFYDDLLDGGLAGEVGDEGDATDPRGDVETVGLRDGWERFDFEIPFVVRDAEEELDAPTIDPLLLPECRFPLDLLLRQLGEGDRFVSEDAQTRTQFGDYRVDGGVMTATGYNDYLSRMTRRIAEALHADITSSAKKYSEVTRYPFLQVHRADLTRWIDAYIRGRLFGQAFDPLEGEHWRVLLVDDISHHIAGSFATALVEAEGAQEVVGAEVLYRYVSEVPSLSVRTTSCVPVAKCIYPKLPIPARSGGLERLFLEWADRDSRVEALVKIHEYKHSFLQQRYLKADGMPGMYSPDFLVRTADAVFVVETKSQTGLSNENVQRKQRAAVAWCDKLNALPPDARGGLEWHYVLVGEAAVRDWHSRNERASDLLAHARLRPTSSTPEQLSL